MLISVALPVPLYKTFDYLPASEDSNPSLPPIGARVTVPFGRQTLIGIVVDYTKISDSPLKPSQLKAIKKVLDATPIISQEVLILAKWLASYYHHPLGDVFSVMLPTLIYQGDPLKTTVQFWKVTDHSHIDGLSKSAHQQRKNFQIIYDYGDLGVMEETLLSMEMTKAQLKILADKGIIERFYQPIPLPPTVKLAQTPLSLNQQQKKAVDQISEAIDYQGFLLYGVTGSGKTEVYLQAMQAILEANQQVLILVPEIGLTPQIKARFEQRFDARILLLHSRLQNSARMAGWEACQQGHAQIIIGTRSSILYSFADLGLIIIDEAHDASYKQQDSLRYHATNVALYRGFKQNIPVILGTATPTLEQLALVKEKKLTQLTLSKRAGNAKPPIFQLVNACRDDSVSNSHNPANTNNANPNYKPKNTIASQQIAGNWQDTGLTQTVITEIRQRLEADEQVLIFLNRRGYAPVLLCHACGWQADCSYCDAHLSVHKGNAHHHTAGYLQCHHCDSRKPMINQCPSCRSGNMKTVGMGTSQLSDHLHALFANPQTNKHCYPVIQIDRDTTRKKDDWQAIYQKILTDKPCILVGTQMVAKGHHFPNVTLVVIPNADSGFLSADFRSPEHTAQLIVQVAGRAGRGDKMGKVMIQTLQPNNPLLLSLISKGYLEFANKLMKEREVMSLPPYIYACLIRCDGKVFNSSKQALQKVLAVLTQQCRLLNYDIKISDVIDAPLARKNQRYHFQGLLLSKNRNHLHSLLNDIWHVALAMPEVKYVRLSLDIDPIRW